MINSEMKLRTTTPASTSTYLARVTAVVALIVMAVAVPVQYFASRPSIASADQYDAKIQALKDKVSNYQDQANALREQAKSLQNTLGQIAADKAAIQTQIDLYQTQYDQLVKDIDATKKRIEENRKSTGQLIVASSMSGDIPLIVRLASSENLADYIDNEASRARIRDSIVQKTEENTKLKQQLEQKQAEVKVVLDQQKDARTALLTKEDQQSRLLQETQGNEATYQKMIQDSDSEMKRLQEEQRKANQVSLGGNLPAATGGTGGYPYVGGWVGGTGGFSPLVDPWGFYYQQCTSYVAWKVYDSGKNMPTWGRMYASANARDWPSFTSNKGSEPRKGAAAVMTSGVYGHVMYVEEVYGNGRIRVSDYNLGFDGLYRTYDRSASGLVYIYF